MKVQIFAFLTTVVAIVSAAPTANVKRSETYKPDAMVQIKEQMPETPQGLTDEGRVERVNGWNNVQTLLSIPIPSGASGSCSLSFTNPITVTGSKEMQLFTVGDNKPIDASTTYYSRPYRDQHIATIHLRSGSAEFETFGTWNGNSIPCPAGKRLNLELVPVGDHDEVTWKLPDGLTIVSS